MNKNQKKKKCWAKSRRRCWPADTKIVDIMVKELLGNTQKNEPTHIFEPRNA